MEHSFKEAECECKECKKINFIGFSALCVLTWGLAMHYFVDGNESILEDVTASTSLEHPIVVDEKCWKGYPTLPYIWILAGPMTMALLVSGHSFMTSQNFGSHSSKNLTIFFGNSLGQCSKNFSLNFIV